MMTKTEIQQEELICIQRRKQADAVHMLKIALIALKRGKLNVVEDHIERSISYIDKTS